MKTITINKQNLSLKEYNGQRVVTFKDIDTVHGRPDGTARKRFNDNKKHFIEDVDFFRVQPSEIRTVGITSPNGGIVVTESGYLMLAKSFTDDLAWTVQRELVNSYFKAKEECYEYFDKTYYGEPVITMKDFKYFTGANHGTAEWWIRNKNILKKNVDYYFLEGQAIQNFKAENPQMSKLTRYLILLNKNGFIKLCSALGIKIALPDCLTLPPKQVQKPFMNLKYEVLDVVDAPENSKIKDGIKNIMQKCNALISVLELSNKYYSVQDYEKQMFTLRQLGMDLSTDVCEFSRIQPNIIQKVY